MCIVRVVDQKRFYFVSSANGGTSSGVGSLLSTKLRDAQPDKITSVSLVLSLNADPKSTELLTKTKNLPRKVCETVVRFKPG